MTTEPKDSQFPSPITSMFEEIQDAPRDRFPFETIKFSGRVEILDREGRVARFRRRQRIRFLEDGVSVFFDRIWGEGVLLAGYQTSSLRIIDAIPSRKGYVIALALPRPFSRGEVLDIETERRIVGAFVYDWGYWDSAMAVPTELLAIDVRTPAGLNMRRPDIVAPAHGQMDATASHRHLTFRVSKPALDIPYKLRWNWG
jgi:hypothetical protein